MLRAELSGDDDERIRILDAELNDGWWPEVTPMAFGIAALRRFGDRRLVTVFARRFVDRAPGAAGFSPRTVEAVVRGAIGGATEAWLLAAVDPGLAGEIMYAGLFALADDLGLDDEQCVQLLAEAEAVLAAVTLPWGDGADAREFVVGEHHRTGQRYLTDADRLPDLTRRVRSPRRPAARPKSRKAERRLPPAREPASVVGRYLFALALHQELDARGAERHSKELGTLALVVLIILLPRYLPANPDQREIANLVKLTWERFRPKTDPITMEHMVRRALREEIPVDDISATDRYLTAVLVLTAISDDWNSDARAIGAVIADAEDIVISEGKPLTPA